MIIQFKLLINIFYSQGGVEINVLPNELSVAFDIRVAPDVNFTKFDKMIKGWLKEAGEGITYSIINRDIPVESTKLDESNPFWIAFKKTFEDHGLELQQVISAAASDARFLRAVSFYHKFMKTIYRYIGSIT